MYTFSLDLLAPVVTSSVTATSATIVLSQPMDSLPADQYTVTLTRRTGDGQFICTTDSGTVTMISFSNSVLFEGLEEFSVYSLTIEARHDFFDIVEPLHGLNITTLSAGEHSGCVESGT